MTEPNKRVVQRRSDGDWEVRKPGADRASVVTSTQAEGIERARTILGNDGGGELQVRSLKGTIQGHPRGDVGELRGNCDPYLDEDERDAACAIEPRTYGRRGTSQART